MPEEHPLPLLADGVEYRPGMNLWASFLVHGKVFPWSPPSGAKLEMRRLGPDSDPHVGWAFLFTNGTIMSLNMLASSPSCALAKARRLAESRLDAARSEMDAAQEALTAVLHAAGDGK